MFVWILELKTNCYGNTYNEILGIFEDTLEANSAYAKVVKVISSPNKQYPDEIYLYPMELNKLYPSDYNSKVTVI